MPNNILPMPSSGVHTAFENSHPEQPQVNSAPPLKNVVPTPLKATKRQRGLHKKLIGQLLAQHGGIHYKFKS